MTRSVERWQERVRDGEREMTLAPLAVTPGGELRNADLEARSPRDALVQYCDLHRWRIGECGPFVEPPVATAGRIYPCDGGDPPRAVVVVPVAVERMHDTPSRGGRILTWYWGGIYRVEVR